jgi:hypothetical protein
VYEVEYAGAEQLYRALLVQSNIAKRAASGAPPPPRPAQPSQPASVCSADTLCARANELFALMDADGDGVIDRCVITLSTVLPCIAHVYSFCCGKHGLLPVSYDLPALFKRGA